MEFPELIAHRGLHSESVPENSMSAFREALNHGLAIELDVHLTKDCRVVVFHDENLKRMTGIDAKLEDFTYEQLCAFRLKDSGEKIPLLAEVLKLVSGRVPIFVEIKEGSPVGILEKRLDALMKKYSGSWCVMSFNPLRINWFRKNSPCVCRGILISKFKNKFNGDFIKKSIASQSFVWKNLAQPDFVAYDLRCVTMEAIVEAFNNSCAFIGWTARSEELLTEALKFCKSVIFENIPPQKAIEISQEQN